jgi:hypothetical protein
VELVVDTGAGEVSDARAQGHEVPAALAIDVADTVALEVGVRAVDAAVEDADVDQRGARLHGVRLLGPNLLHVPLQ